MSTGGTLGTPADLRFLFHAAARRGRARRSAPTSRPRARMSWTRSPPSSSTRRHRAAVPGGRSRRLPPPRAHRALQAPQARPPCRRPLDHAGQSDLDRATRYRRRSAPGVCPRIESGAHDPFRNQRQNAELATDAGGTARAPRHAPGGVGCFDSTSAVVYANTAFTMLTGAAARRLARGGAAGRASCATLGDAPRRIRIANRMPISGTLFRIDAELIGLVLDVGAHEARRGAGRGAVGAAAGGDVRRLGPDPEALFEVVAEEAGRLLHARSAATIRYEGDYALTSGAGRATTSAGSRRLAGAAGGLRRADRAGLARGRAGADRQLRGRARRGRRADVPARLPVLHGRDPRPASSAQGSMGLAPRSSRSNHSFAIFQSRFTVSREIFNASAVSSRVSPPKNRISTT